MTLGLSKNAHAPGKGSLFSFWHEFMRYSQPPSSLSIHPFTPSPVSHPSAQRVFPDYLFWCWSDRKRSQNAEEEADLKGGWWLRRGTPLREMQRWVSPPRLHSLLALGMGSHSGPCVAWTMIKDGLWCSLNPVALIISLRGHFLLSQREKMWYTIPCTVRERRHGEEGKQVQEGNGNGGRKNTVRKILHPGPL